MSQDIEERLAAWLDGALSPEEAEALETELARDPELARRAAEWRANDEFIAGALRPVAEGPIDEDLLARMGLAEPAMLAAANDNPPFWRRHMLPLGGAIAASIATVLLLAVPRGGQQPDALSLALDTTPSLRTTHLADGREIEPTLTVRAADGRWCREFRSGGETSLACRGSSGWKVEASTKATGPAGSGEVGLAAGADASGLDATYRRLGASDPVGGNEEAALIARGWNSR